MGMFCSGLVKRLSPPNAADFVYTCCMVQPNPDFKTQVTDATYDDGVLRPLTPLILREHERVRLIVQSGVLEGADSAQPTGRRRAIEQLRAGIASMNFQSSAPYPTRGELHDCD